MPYTKGLRHFKERPVHVACPVCAYRADQKAANPRMMRFWRALPAV